MLQLATILATDDTTPFQTVQAELTEGDEQLLERIQQFGFTSVAPAGSQALVGFVGGSHSHGVVIGTDHPVARQLGLNEGDACLYSLAGARVIVRATGAIEIVASGQPVSIVGDVQVSGSITATGDVVANGVSLKTHTHPAPGGTTGPPN